MLAISTLNVVNRVAARIRYGRARLGRARLLHPVLQWRRVTAQRSAEAYFTAGGPGGEIVPALAGGSTAGAGWTDYHLLHRYVLSRRPRRVLEFGSGKTTVVMAHALAVAHRAFPRREPGHLYSLEDLPRFHEEVKRRMPDDLMPYVTLLCREKRESHWHGDIWGFHYAEIPPGSFDFVFVDGPTEYRDQQAVRQGTKGVCLDLLYLLERDSDASMDVVVDQKLNSLEAYESVLPRGTARYDPVMDVGVLVGVEGRMLCARRRDARIRRGDAWRMLGLA